MTKYKEWCLAFKERRKAANEYFDFLVSTAIEFNKALQEFLQCDKDVQLKVVPIDEETSTARSYHELEAIKNIEGTSLYGLTFLVPMPKFAGKPAAWVGIPIAFRRVKNKLEVTLDPKGKAQKVTVDPKDKDKFKKTIEGISDTVIENYKYGFTKFIENGSERRIFGLGVDEK